MVAPWTQKELAQVRPMLAPYGPDAEGYFCSGNLGILYRAFHTTEESRKDAQPRSSSSGLVIAWDGRLDNREELIHELSMELRNEPAESEVALAAYERWGMTSFAKLLGDWAVSIWNPKDQLLILAKDFIGTRHLYYSVTKEQVTWCTLLDPFVLRADHRMELDCEYIAGWLGFLPSPCLTPYADVHSVPPSCSVRLSKGARTCSRYWEFNSTTQIRYRTDADYEAHFRTVFADAVRRRLRSDSVVVAELSGGMDSSSIVCVADTIIGRTAEAPQLDTVSFCDDSEPNWNERPYIAKVHEQRRQAGTLINSGSHEYLTLVRDRFTPTPASATRDMASEQFEALLRSRRARVVLSGVGGDELLGGVPTPIPELADLLACIQFLNLAHRLKLWALKTRKTWLQLFFEVAREFVSRDLLSRPQHERPAPWLTSSLVRRYRDALGGYETRLRFCGPAPSFQEALRSIESLRRQIAAIPLPSTLLYEKRYPYLDRALIEFVLAIPREQLLRPGERRSLMRRALRGIVPEEVLNRRRKGYVIRAPILSICRDLHALRNLADGMVCAGMDIVDANCYRNALEQASRNAAFPMVRFIRMVNLETWLRATIQSGYVRAPLVHQSPNFGENRIGRAATEQRRYSQTLDAKRPFGVQP